LTPEFCDHFPNAIAALWVDTDSWFIEDRKLWGVQKSAGQIKPAEHPFGVILHLIIGTIAKSSPLQCPLDF
jgi:hypothetical protein